MAESERIERERERERGIRVSDNNWSDVYQFRGLEELTAKAASLHHPFSSNFLPLNVVLLLFTPDPPPPSPVFFSRTWINRQRTFSATFLANCVFEIRP